MATKIDLREYIKQVRNNLKLDVSDEIIEKDLLLTFILAEFEKLGLAKELIFKGGTLLSRNYLKYHRFSEDLDFVHKDSNFLRKLTRLNRERKIKKFMDYFVPELKKVADTLDLEFSTDRSNTRFCTILHGRVVYIFRLYYSKTQYIKIEINFIEKIIDKPIEMSVKAITDFFDSKELMFILGLKKENFNVLSYTISEIILEKYRALLTRKDFMIRDLFDLYLIPNSLRVNIEEVSEKISSSSLIKRGLTESVSEKLGLLKEDKFFMSEERIDDLAIVKYNPEGFEDFKEKIKPTLIKICESFLTNPNNP